MFSKIEPNETDHPFPRRFFQIAPYTSRGGCPLREASYFERLWLSRKADRFSGGRHASSVPSTRNHHGHGMGLQNRHMVRRTNSAQGRWIAATPLPSQTLETRDTRLEGKDKELLLQLARKILR